MHKGKIAYVTDKGFGFISIDGREKNLFFHARNLKNVPFADLQIGDEVTIDNIETGEKGDVAVGVKLVD